MERHADLQPVTSAFDFGAITAAAALAHDMGNPPFGHAGEVALSDHFKTPAASRLESLVSRETWQDLNKFEGNAQGFRILNKKQYGLKLTYATLGAFTKYPCPSWLQNRDTKKRSQKKFGFFTQEKEAFADVANHLGLIAAGDFAWCRHPLAFLVEAADDICYSIIDLEDGCRLNLVPFNDTVDLLSPILGAKLDRNKLSSSSDLNAKLGTLRALAIGELIEATTEIFLAHEVDILRGKFDHALTDLCRFSKALGDINKISVEKIYRTQSVVEIEAAGYVVLPGLLEEFLPAAEELASGQKMSRRHHNLSLLLPEDIRQSIIASKDDPDQMVRHVLDFVSGLTDRHALSMYRKIKGISF